MCQSMVNIQSPTAEIRRGKKRRRRKKKKEETAWKYYGLPYYIGRPWKLASWTLWALAKTHKRLLSRKLQMLTWASNKTHTQKCCFVYYRETVASIVCFCVVSCQVLFREFTRGACVFVANGLFITVTRKLQCKTTSSTCCRRIMLLVNSFIIYVWNKVDYWTIVIESTQSRLESESIQSTDLESASSTESMITLQRGEIRMHCHIGIINSCVFITSFITKKH